MANHQHHQFCDIDADTIELHAMGRLPDAAVREHLDTCPSCAARVAEERSFIALLTKVLRELRDTGFDAPRDGKARLGHRPEGS